MKKLLSILLTLMIFVMGAFLVSCDVENTPDNNDNSNEYVKNFNNNRF